MRNYEDGQIKHTMNSLIHVFQHIYTFLNEFLTDKKYLVFSHVFSLLKILNQLKDTLIPNLN